MQPLEGAGGAVTSPAQDPLEKLEAAMLQLPQVECAGAHHFGPGVYMREVSIPAGTFAIGHAQRYPHLNVMVRGRVAIFTEQGERIELCAPLTFTGNPGRKVGYVLEDMVWLNIYPNVEGERDIDVLEARWLDKSSTWQANEAQRLLAARERHVADREDYALLLAQAGFSPDVALAQSRNEADLVDVALAGLTVRPSPIEGLGLFATSPIEAGAVIAPARIGGMRTLAGRYTNHCAQPNAAMVLRPDGDVDLVATRRIAGCRGGDAGEEITIDYRQALALAGIRFEETPCLQ